MTLPTLHWSKPVTIATCIAVGFVLHVPRAHADAEPAARRIALIVGANAAPAGRRELRYALDDAQRMADTLRRVGRFAKDDVHILLEPSPAGVLAELDQIAAQAAATPETLLLFYYSGHSDGQALFPHGESLRLADVRQRLLNVRARVRVGVLDTCRGGSWTQAKDLSLGPPLPAADLVALDSEGTVLIAASSGLESAHEAEALHGSFFTHHLTAGLTGAADRSGDGSITLQEAFEYARERTVRDSARYAPLPQHPSFEIELRGRQDLVLAQVASSGSVLELEQEKGPLEVIELARGTTVAELPRGVRHARLALKPGRYLVRSVASSGIYSKELEVPVAGRVIIREAQLERADATALAMKGGQAQPVPRGQATSSAQGWFQLSLAAGVSTGPASGANSSLFGTRSRPLDALKRSFASEGALTYALTDRLTWAIPMPAVAYRFGETGRFEVIPRLGLVGFGYSSLSGLLGSTDLGVGTRIWTSLSQSIIAGLWGGHTFSIATSDAQPDTALRKWSLNASAGYGLTIRNIVSLYLGVGFQHVKQLSSQQPVRPSEVANVLHIGSVLMLGYRSLPLVQVHLTPEFSLDVRASWAIVLNTGAWYDSYLGGFTWDF